MKLLMPLELCISKAVCCFSASKWHCYIISSTWDKFDSFPGCWLLSSSVARTSIKPWWVRDCVKFYRESCSGQHLFINVVNPGIGQDCARVRTAGKANEVQDFRFICFAICRRLIPSETELWSEKDIYFVNFKSKQWGRCLLSVISTLP